MPGQVYRARPIAPRAGAARGRPDAGTPLSLAALCLAALALIWLVAEHVPAAQLRDAVALRDLTLLKHPQVEAGGNFLLHLISPLWMVVWGALLAGIAVARGRPKVALVVIAVIALAPFTADTLKPLLAHPHMRAGAVRIGPASWPSGHSAAALALALCAVLVAPARARPLVAAVGAIFTLAVGLALLILAWHMPSDVLGGYLVAVLWMALAVACLRAAELRRPSRRSAQEPRSPAPGR